MNASCQLAKDGIHVRDGSDTLHIEEVTVIPQGWEGRTKEVDAIDEIKHFLSQKVEIEFGATEVDDKVPLAYFELFLELNKQGGSRAGGTVSCRVLYCLFNLNKVNPSQLCLTLNDL